MRTRNYRWFLQMPDQSYTNLIPSFACHARAFLFTIRSPVSGTVFDAEMICFLQVKLKSQLPSSGKRLNLSADHVYSSSNKFGALLPSWLRCFPDTSTSWLLVKSYDGGTSLHEIVVPDAERLLGLITTCWSRLHESLKLSRLKANLPPDTHFATRPLTVAVAVAAAAAVVLSTSSC
jgi:hypothetical protein